MLDLVACRICGLQRRRLGAHIKAAHGLSHDGYLETFPDALLEAQGTRARSAECRARQSESAKRRWSDPDARQEQSERLKSSAPWKGKRLTQEHRDAISAGGKGVSHELRPEYREELRRRSREALERLRERPDYHQRLSEGQRRRVASGIKSGFQIPGVLERGYQTRIRNGTLTPIGVGRGICGFRRDLSHYTRSTMEANFARILLASGVGYEYEPKVFNLGPLGFYTPDFLLLAPLTIGDRVLVEAGWVELKGWRAKNGGLPGKAQEKIDAVGAVTGQTAIALAGRDPVWQALSGYWQSKIALWETPRKNLRTDPSLFAGLGR